MCLEVPSHRASKFQIVLTQSRAHTHTHTCRARQSGPSSHDIDNKSTHSIRNAHTRSLGLSRARRAFSMQRQHRFTCRNRSIMTVQAACTEVPKEGVAFFFNAILLLPLVRWSQVNAFPHIAHRYSSGTPSTHDVKEENANRNSPKEKRRKRIKYESFLLARKQANRRIFEKFSTAFRWHSRRIDRERREKNAIAIAMPNRSVSLNWRFFL